MNPFPPEKAKELDALERELSGMSDLEGACQRLVARICAIFNLQEAVALREQPAGRWRLVGSAGAVPVERPFLEAFAAARSAAGRDESFLDVSVNGAIWSGMLLGSRDLPQLALLVRGDWRTVQHVLRAAREGLTRALERPALRASQRPFRRMAVALALPGRLAREDDEGRIYQLIVDTAAQAVGTRMASVAIYDQARSSLAIVATSGYASALVRHMRILPGSGIIGSVFRTGRPLCVADMRQQNPMARVRRRYRTPSFVSVPLPGATGPIGVVSLSDRVDSRAFDRRDQRTLQRIAEVASLALERLRAEQQARASAQLAGVDVLTNLFNRRHFQARLEEEVERARRQGSPLTLMMIDIDKLKQLNDRLGHPSGDAVLGLFGDVLHRLVRMFDVCARMGGDEFAVLMPGSSAEDSRLIAERIRQGIEDVQPPGGPRADDLRVSASLGIATFDGTTSDLLVKRADEALYSAKMAGGNRVELHGAAASER